VENALNLRDFLEGKDCSLIVTDDKEGDSSEFERHLEDAEIIITTPFHPAYITRERMDKARKLQLLLTAGIGSDHVDLEAAAERDLTVAEVTGSNTVSVAEDEVMRILLMMRNFIPAHEQAINGEWDVPKVAGKSRDLQGKAVGSLGGGAIGSLVMERLKPFGVDLYYLDRKENPAMEDLGVQLVKDIDEFLGKCDVVTINVPLTKQTKGMIDTDKIGKMKKGAFLINNARGAIVDQDAVVEALESGQLAGYAGDVWPQQPAPEDHPWRTMPNNGMTPHTSGTTLDAQARYQEGVQKMLEQWLDGDAF
jgi:formate dehydrogenase